MDYTDVLRSLAINDTHFAEDGTDVEFHALDRRRWLSSAWPR